MKQNYGLLALLGISILFSFIVPYYFIGFILVLIIYFTIKNPLYTLSLGILLFIYWIASENMNQEIILPKISLIIKYGKDLPKNIIIDHVFSTVFKAFMAYIFSLIIAFVLALLSNLKGLYKLISPYISILKTIPTISVIIILLIWFGKDKAVYLIPILVILPILYEMFYDSMINVNKQLIEVCQVYQLNWWMRIRYLYAYKILEGLVLSLKQTFGLCFKVIVMAEVIGGAKKGIGAKILQEKISLEMPGVFFWTILLIVIVLMMDELIKIISTKSLKWR